MVQNKEVKLEEFDKKTEFRYHDVKIPNTFSAIIQFHGEQIILKQVGGCTANALLGRFTFANPGIEIQCKNIVDTEKKANPEVIFADIGYQVEKNIEIDNVNRRKNIYDLELAILTYPNAKHLSFDDLLVGIQNDEITLRSKKHNKRIIPRLTSVYNYTKSDLSLYRFLSDLQNQDLQTNLSTQARNLFPNLEYYPRLKYKNIVLSPKTWKVPQQFCNPQTLRPEQLGLLKIWLKKQGVSRYFKCGEADQHLYFKSNNEEDLNHFLQYCKRKEFLYITEAFIPHQAFTKDSNGQPYNSEFAIALAHTNHIYSSLKKPGLESLNHHKSIQLPGEEWLYFEIYMHHLRINNFLMNILPNFLKEAKGQFKNWFFIRYNLPSSHIRLRFQRKDNADTSLLISLLSSFLSKNIKDGIITDLQIKPYFREIERFGFKNIEKVERYFGIDSKYVLNLLQLNLEDSTLYLFTSRFILTLFLRLNLSIQEQLAHVEDLNKNLSNEMKIDTLGFKKINEYYELTKISKNLKISKAIEKNNLIVVEQIVKLVANAEQPKRLQLLADITHMHINRLFTTDQRMHEMIIYQYLQKYLMVKYKRLMPFV